MIDWVVIGLKRELDGGITMDIEQALEILKSSKVDLGEEANDALDLMCDFVHDTLQREKREYAACEEYTRRKEEET
jgi:hypothetical protein